MWPRRPRDRRPAKPKSGDKTRPRRSRLRQLQRGVKVGAAITLALAAGTFLGVQRLVSSPATGGDDGLVAQAAADVEGTGDGTAAGTGEGTALGTGEGTGLEVYQPRERQPPVVDPEEHRHGMPVPDNLLE